LPLHPDLIWGPLSLLSIGYWGLSLPRDIMIGHKTDHSPPSSAEVKNMWNCYFHSLLRLHSMVLG